MLKKPTKKAESHSENVQALLALLGGTNMKDVPLTLSGADLGTNALLDTLCPGLAAKCVEANAKMPLDQANAMFALVKSIEFSDGTKWNVPQDKNEEAGDD